MTRVVLKNPPDALRRAARLIADAAVGISGKFSRKIPPTIRVAGNGTSLPKSRVAIVAGGPGGLEAPNAAMFESPGARHPLFGLGYPGHRGHRRWTYVQPYRPFMEEAAEQAGQDACDKYADLLIDAWWH